MHLAARGLRGCSPTSPPRGGAGSEPASLDPRRADRRSRASTTFLPAYFQVRLGRRMDFGCSRRTRKKGSSCQKPGRRRTVTYLRGGGSGIGWLDAGQAILRQPEACPAARGHRQSLERESTQSASTRHPPGPGQRQVELSVEALREPPLYPAIVLRADPHSWRPH